MYSCKTFHSIVIHGVLVWFKQHAPIHKHYTFQLKPGRQNTSILANSPENRCKATLFSPHDCTSGPLQRLAFGQLFSVTTILLAEPAGYCTGQALQPPVFSEHGDSACLLGSFLCVASHSKSLRRHGDNRQLSLNFLYQDDIENKLPTVELIDHS